jgi:hypothetical protein
MHKNEAFGKRCTKKIRQKGGVAQRDATWRNVMQRDAM